MRITESKLRRIIRSVIKESLDSLGSPEKISGSIDCVTAEGNLFQNVCSFLKRKLEAVLEAGTVECAFTAKELAQVCMLDRDRGRGEDALYDNKKVMCEFNVVSSKNRYDFISADGMCKSFSVHAELQDQDSFYHKYNDVVLYLSEYQD